MEFLNSVIATVHVWLDRLSQQTWLDPSLPIFSNPPPELLAVALLIPVALALASRKILAIVATALLMGLAWIAVFHAARFTALAPKALYIGGLVIAVIGLFAGRRDRRLRAELAAAQANVERLEHAEARRYVIDLKARGAETAAKEEAKRSGQ